MFVFVVIACLLGAAAAAPSGYGSSYGVAAIDSYSVPRYEFNYAVNDPGTGDNKQQSESRDGDVVKGSYSLREPDGTLRVVEYTADSLRGFNAIVKRVGAAAHPQVIAPVVSKQIVAPIAAPIYEPIAAPIYEPLAQPIAAPILNDYAYTADFGGFGGLDKDLGLGLSSLNLGGIGYGGWKH